MTDYKGIEVIDEMLQRAELEWQEQWKAYCEWNPDADGADYHDEREAFFEGKFGGNFKHV